MREAGLDILKVVLETCKVNVVKKLWNELPKSVIGTELSHDVLNPARVPL